MTVNELAGEQRRNGYRYVRGSDVESTRRAVRKLEAAGLVETRYIWRNNQGQLRLAVRLSDMKNASQG